MKITALTILLLLVTKTFALPASFTPIWPGIEGEKDVDFTDTGDIAADAGHQNYKWFRSIAFDYGTNVITTATPLTSVVLPLTIVFWTQFSNGISRDWKLVRLEDNRGAADAAKFSLSRDTTQTKWVISDGSNTADFTDGGASEIPSTTEP